MNIFSFEERPAASLSTYYFLKSLKKWPDKSTTSYALPDFEIGIKHL